MSEEEIEDTSPISLYETKYAPKTIDDLILNSDLKNMIKTYTANKRIKNLLLCGRPGIGKSTLANIMAKDMNASILRIDAALDNSVDMIRNKVTDFCNSMSIDNKLKIVLIEEAGELTDKSGNGSSAQDALKNVMDMSSSDTRFIFTCNYLNKINEAIRSRCEAIDITFPIEDVVKRVNFILQEEHIRYTKEDLIRFISEIIKKKFPDIRSILVSLESWCVTGELKPVVEVLKDNKAIVETILNTKEPRDIRKYLIQNEVSFGRDYIRLAQDLFNAYDDYKKQLIIADHIYRMHLVTDKEIEFSAMILELKFT